MDRVALPGTPFTVSRLGVGAWTISGAHWGPDVDDARAARMLDAAADAGLDWVDTAPIYGDGHADALVAAFARRRPAVRVFTKVGAARVGGHATSDLRAAAVRADVEASLRRLGRDALDLVQIHWPCERGTPAAETGAALAGLVAAGKVVALGVCNHTPAQVEALRAVVPVATVQAPLSLIRREAEGALLPALRAGPPTGVLVYETLCRGLLAGGRAAPGGFGPGDQRAVDPRFHGAWFHHTRALLDDLGRVAAHLGVPLPALAVSFALSRPGVSAAIVGFRTPEQVAGVVAAPALARRPAVQAAIEKVLALHPPPRGPEPA